MENITENLSEITPLEAMNRAKEIANFTKMGLFSYDEGKLKASPYLHLINEKGLEISKKYKRFYSKLSWAKLLR